MATSFVQAIYDFTTTESGEISLRTGDIVAIVKQVDENWLCGTHKGKTGNFPTSFVQKITLPEIEDGQKLFVATRSFPAEVQGDLGFQKGDIIVGTQCVDQNWWHGQKGSQIGIFPMTHVEELPSVPQAGTPSVPGGASSVNDTSGVSNGAPVAKVCATMDLTAQLDEELSFSKGDVISVVKVIDADFAIGECSGRVGQFPLFCVEVIEGSLETQHMNKEQKRKSKFRWWEEEGAQPVNDSRYPPENAPVPPEQPSYNRQNSQSAVTPISQQQPSLNQNQTSSQSQEPTYPEGGSTLQHADVGSQVDTVKKHYSHKRTGSYTAVNTWSYDTQVTPYAKTLYPFLADNFSELSFSDDEIITLIRHIDDQWMEGEIDGKRGLFPSNYVEIIVDCAPAEEQVGDKNIQPSENSDKADLQTYSAEPELDLYGRVLFDFHAEMKDDLDMKEGDTVTILRKLDDLWFQARHDDGRVGLCPVNFVEVIGAEPCTETPLTPSGEDTGKVVPPSDVIVNKTDEEKVELNNATSVPPEIPTNESQKKPPTKPKPQIKPKPMPKPKPTTTVIAPSSEPSRAPSGSKPATVPRKSMGHGGSSTELAKSRKTSAPVFSQRTVSMEVSLDDVIKSEMKLAVDDAGLSRSSSVQSDRSSDEGSIKSPAMFMNKADSEQFRSSPVTTETPNNARVDAGPAPMAEEIYMRDGRTIGQSTFFNAQHLGEPSRKMSAPPVMGRPPPGRTVTASGKRPAPARPTGPRPAPVPSRTPLIPAPGAGNQDLGPRPVPQRPAPPRPTQAPRPSQAPSKTPPRSRAPGDLMDFSPEKVQEDDENLQTITYLEKRIGEINEDLKKYGQCVIDLDQKLKTVEEEERGEVEENLMFYKANIEGLTAEKLQHKEQLFELVPERAAAEEAARQREEDRKRKAEEESRFREEMLQKRAEQRRKVLSEILETEADFCASLVLCMDTFLGDGVEKCCAIDYETLFGNMDEVVEVSNKLLTSLKSETADKQFKQQLAGPSFVLLKEDMKKVFAPYCRNHDDAIALLTKYEENSEVEDFFQRMVESMRQRATVFDVGSMLIKPVQRILKYPLLLNELLKCTEDDHPDKPHLIEAIRAMTDVAAAINEYKRRKDLVLKYRKDTDTSITDKIARLTMHSTKKKFIRISQRMVGVQIIDDHFNKEERKFVNLDKAVRTLVRNTSTYIETLQDAVSFQESVANDISDYYVEKAQEKDVVEFSKVHNTIATQLFHKFKDAVEDHVVAPLNKLLLMFQGPAKVIKKRHDKLLDYDNISRKEKSTRDEGQLKAIRDELQRSKNNYEAMNAQLLDELPKLYDLSVDVVRDCVARLVREQRAYHNKALDEMYSLLALPLILGTEDSNIIETFNIAHTAVVDRIADMCFIPRSFSPRMEDVGKKPLKAGGKRMSESGRSLMPDSESSVQSDSQRMFVRQLYPADRLYSVTCDYAGQQMMDIALTQGSLVGIIKEGDPMGNKDRWFVDNGAKKGFVPKKILGPVQPSPARDQSPANAVPPSGDLMDLSSPEKRPLSPLDLDFSLTPEPQQPSAVWYEHSHWDQQQAKGTDIMSGYSEGSYLHPQPTTMWYTTPAPSAATCQQTQQPAPSAATYPQTQQPGSSAATYPQTQEINEQQTAVQWQTDPEQNSQNAVVRLEQEGLPPEYDDAIAGPEESEVWQAVYSFTARSPIEVNLEAGEIVTVVQAHDLDGNSDWWLVEVEGRQGYAPANYLYKVSSEC